MRAAVMRAVGVIQTWPMLTGLAHITVLGTTLAVHHELWLQRFAMVTTYYWPHLSQGSHSPCCHTDTCLPLLPGPSWPPPPPLSPASWCPTTSCRTLL